MAHFISLSSQTLYPLQQATKQDPLKWSEECESTFQNVKEVLGSLPTMKVLDFEHDFFVNPSMGEDAIGAMLLQKGKRSHYMRPIYCASQVKLPREHSFFEVELVLASVVYACR